MADSRKCLGTLRAKQRAADDYSSKVAMLRFLLITSADLLDINS